MGDEARGRPDLALRRAAFDGAMKELCKRAGYTVLTIGVGRDTIKAGPSKNKLGSIMHKLRIPTHEVGKFQSQEILIYWDVVTVPNWEYKELLEPARVYDLS